MTHPLTSPLIEKRRQVGATNPGGRRYSNLIGELENVETVAEPWRRSNLLAGIQRTIAAIQQIRRDGGQYIHANHMPRHQ